MRSMSQKGVALGFLLGLVLAALLFFFTLTCTTRLYEKIGEQDVLVHFEQLHGKIQKHAAQAPAGAFEIFVAELGQGDFLVGFNEGKDVEVCSKEECKKAAYPKEGCAGSACICLCKEGKLTETLQCGEMICKKTAGVAFSAVELDFELVEAATSGGAKGPKLTQEIAVEHTFSIKDGFLIGHVDYAAANPFLFQQQNKAFYLHKPAQDMVAVCEEHKPDCGIANAK